ncbi:MAG: hypothetical protein ACI85V_003437, partial [bacterium]
MFHHHLKKASDMQTLSDIREVIRANHLRDEDAVLGDIVKRADL